MKIQLIKCFTWASVLGVILFYERGCQHLELLPSFCRVDKGRVLRAFISSSQIEDRFKDSLYIYLRMPIYAWNIKFHVIWLFYVSVLWTAHSCWYCSEQIRNKASVYSSQDKWNFQISSCLVKPVAPNKCLFLRLFKLDLPKICIE